VNEESPNAFWLALGLFLFWMIMKQELSLSAYLISTHEFAERTVNL